MSGAATRIPLALATERAEELLDLLRPHCERIAVAGSVRRGRADVGDLEVVCVPRVEHDADLFGAPVGHGFNALDAEVTDLLLRGVLADRLDKDGRKSRGPRAKRLLFRGVGVDLFSVLPPAQWGCLFAIRTGPRWFSKALVVPENEAVRDEAGREMCAGLMPEWLRHREGRYIHARDGDPFETPEERDVFTLLRLDWIEPRDRDAFMAGRMAAHAAVAGVRS